MLPAPFAFLLLSLSAFATPLPNAPVSPFPLVEERDSQAGVAFSERAFNLDTSASGLEERSDKAMVAERDSTPVLISFSLPILFPTLGSVFKAGGQGTVSWNATLPSTISMNQTQPTARLVLGYTADGVLGYNLDIENPLLTDIPLFTPPYSANFTFPSDLPTRSTYLVALMGSSGNVSPKFTIEGADSNSDATETTFDSAASSPTYVASTFNPMTVGNSGSATSAPSSTATNPVSDAPSSTPAPASSRSASVISSSTATLAQASSGVTTSAANSLEGSILLGLAGSVLAFWFA